MTDHLARQHGLLDALIYAKSPVHSSSQYQGYTTTYKEFTQIKEFVPQSSTIPISTGGTTVIEFPLQADRLGPIQLVFDISALTTTGGTFRRFSDFVGLACWEKIELRYTANSVETLYPEQLWAKAHKLYSKEEYNTIIEELVGDKTVTERNNLAAAVQKDVIVDLPFNFTKHPGRHLELYQLAQQPRIIIHWRKPEAFVETDGTAPVFTFDNLVLKACLKHHLADERDLTTRKIETLDGLHKIFEEWTIQENDILTGAVGVQKIELKNFRTSMRGFFFMVRLVSDLTTPLSAKQFDNLQLWDKFRITSAGSEPVTDWVSFKYNTTYMHRHLFHVAEHGDFIGFWFFDQEPLDELNCDNAYNFAALTNPTLELDFGSTPLAADVRVTIGGSHWNVTQNIRGDYSVSFKQ